MKIAINTTSAVAGGGITYLKNLLIGLSKIDTPHHYVILTTLSGKETFYFQHPNFTFLSFKLPSRNSLLRLCWEQVFLPIFLKRVNIDILFSPANVCPLYALCPNVVMVQNIEPFGDGGRKNRGFIQKIRLKVLKLLTILSVKKAHITICPSAKAYTDIKKAGVKVKHVEVIYHGLNREIFHPHHDENRLSRFKKKYGLDKFILSVSNIQRYKNFFELIKAFVFLKDRIENDIRLVFAGTCFDSEYCDEMKAFIREYGYDGRVIFLGNVSCEELPYLYSACKLFVYPSTCESFGMTLVEAMACGAPVLASQTEPMPEICGDAAVYFDPTNPAAISDAILKTLNDRDLISVLIKNSLERAKIFSWENTARNTLKAFESAALK